jgi:hypothetical protein
MNDARFALGSWTVLIPEDFFVFRNIFSFALVLGAVGKWRGRRKHRKCNGFFSVKQGGERQ